MRLGYDDMLPIRAFSPRFGVRGPFSHGMTLEGGGKGGGGSAPSADPNIGLAQQKMAQISDEYLQQWKTEVWPEMKAQAQKQEERADEQFELDKITQQKQTAIADEQYQRYKDVYRPMQDDIVRQANEYDTEANRERMAAEAIGDTKNAFAIKQQDDERKMQSYGINPTSGQFSGMRNANSVMEAATAASAATRTREAARQLGWAKKMDAIGLGSGVFGNQATSTGLALNAGNQALMSGQIPMQNANMMGSSMGSAYGGANAGWGQVGQLGVQKYNADVNAYEARVKADTTGSAGFGNLVGTLGGAAISKYSDRRMKKDIQLIGQLDSGLNIYSFEYRDEFKDIAGEGKQIGVMADEVEQLIPHAVTVMPNGYKAVNYGLVG